MGLWKWRNLWWESIGNKMYGMSKSKETGEQVNICKDLVGIESRRMDDFTWHNSTWLLCALRWEGTISLQLVV